MRINYTLPGYQPVTDAAIEVTESFDSPFQNRMRAFERRQPVAWRELLRLNNTPPDPERVGPPPKSSTSEMTDPTIVRQQWRQLLSRHSEDEDVQNAPPAVRRMLGLLQHYQAESEKLLARGLSGAGQ